MGSIADLLRMFLENRSSQIVPTNPNGFPMAQPAKAYAAPRAPAPPSGGIRG